MKKILSNIILSSVPAGGLAPLVTKSSASTVVTGTWLAVAAHHHYCDVTMGKMAYLITSLTSVYSTVHSGADQSSASLAFVWGIHRRPVNSPHKGPVNRKMFPFDDVIMCGTRIGSVRRISLGVESKVYWSLNNTVNHLENSRIRYPLVRPRGLLFCQFTIDKCSSFTTAVLLAIVL